MVTKQRVEAAGIHQNLVIDRKRKAHYFCNDDPRAKAQSMAPLALAHPQVHETADIDDDYRENQEHADKG